MVTVFFRYDDYSSLSAGSVDRGLIDIFARLHVTCTFAVVPAITSLYPEVQGMGIDIPLNAEKAAELKSAVECGAVDVALHGWNHLTNRYSAPPVPSEFCGLSVNDQVAILRRGKEYLSDQIGVDPIVFVPPWNTYDDGTLEALSRCGFLGVSANRYSPVSGSGDHLKYIPMTIEILELRNAVRVAQECGEVDPIIGVMLHPYDFHESGDARSVMSLSDFERELSWLCNHANVRISCLSALVISGGALGVERYSANMPSVLERIFPSFIPKAFSCPLYSTATYARRRKLHAHLQLSIFHLLIIAFGAGAGWVGGGILDSLNASLLPVTLMVLLCLVIGLVSRAIMLRAIYAKAVQLIALMLGLSLGLILS